MSWHIFDVAVRIGMDVTFAVCVASILRAGHRNGMRRVAAIKRADQRPEVRRIPANVVNIGARAPRGAA